LADSDFLRIFAASTIDNDEKIIIRPMYARTGDMPEYSSSCPQQQNES
jgi:hypothetical protein